MLLSAIQIFLSFHLVAQELQFLDFTLRIDSQYNVNFDGLFGGKQLFIEDLERDKDQFQSYSQFLAYLQRIAPEIFQRPVLVHSSGSLQYSSFQRPRTILFGRGVVFAFSEPPHTNVRRVEMLELNPNTYKFGAHEIEFAEQGGVSIHRSPQVCIACHGVDKRPLWEPYDVWPKIYGSHTGLFLSEQETDKYREYVSQTEKVGIYALLPNTPWARDLRIHSNDSFVTYLNSLNNLRMVRNWQDNSQLRPFRYALTAFANGCTSDQFSSTNTKLYDVKDFIPDNLLNTTSLTYQDLKEVLSERRQQLFVNLQSHYADLFDNFRPNLEITHRLDWEVDLVTGMSLVLENMEVPWRSFLMSHGENHMSIQVPSNLAMDLGGFMSVYDIALAQELMPQDVSQFGIRGGLHYDCQKLSSRSLAELNNSAVTWRLNPQSRLNDVSPAVSRCVSCHSMKATRRDNPFIPFHNTQWLKTWLRQDNNEPKLEEMVVSGRMPKGSRLNEEEKAALLAALKSIE